jgi:hypothetical protein
MDWQVNIVLEVETKAVGRRPVAASGGLGDEGENSYAAALLGKILISIGGAQQWTMPMVCACYVGCMLELLLLARWRGELKCCELQNGCFCQGLSLIPT